MISRNIIGAVVLTSFLIGVATTYIMINVEEINKWNHDVFIVDDEHDDSRTFTVMLNELMSENEDGGWATLQLSPSYSFGVRFNNVSIPKNATIKDAYVELYSIGTPGHLHPNCVIYCDDVDSAENFTLIGVLNISGRIYTNESVTWNQTIEYGKWIKTPSITSCIKEVISRSNWSSGNSIAVLFDSEGYRGYSAAFRNYEQGSPAKLHIIWD
jgi:hypothetical protein